MISSSAQFTATDDVQFRDVTAASTASVGALLIDNKQLDTNGISKNDVLKFNGTKFVTVPEGTYGRIAPRSGLSKKGLLVNAGVIDRDYTGPVKIMLHNLTNETYIISKKDRIAQLILEKIELSDIKLVDSLVTTDRGEGGFGSTGK